MSSPQSPSHSSLWDPEPIDINYSITVDTSETINHHCADSTFHNYHGANQYDYSEDSQKDKNHETAIDDELFDHLTSTSRRKIDNSFGGNGGNRSNAQITEHSATNHAIVNETSNQIFNKTRQYDDSHYGYITTPLISQVLNDEKKKLNESIAEEFKRKEKVTNSASSTNHMFIVNGKLGDLFKHNKTKMRDVLPLRFGRLFERNGSENDLPPKGLFSSFLKKGNVIDDSCGMYPIHKACIEYPDNAKLIGMMIRTLPKSTAFQVKKVKQPSSSSSDPKSSSSGDCTSTTVSSTSTTAQYSTYSSSNISNTTSSTDNQKKRKKIPLNCCSTITKFSNQVKSLNFLDGMYPLHIAVSNAASMEVLKLLVRSNPQVLSLADSNGMVPLSLAFRCYDRSIDLEYFHEMVSFILASNPSATSVADGRSNTPLHYACMAYFHAGGVRQQQRRKSNLSESASSLSISTTASLTTQPQVVTQPTNNSSSRRSSFNSQTSRSSTQRSSSPFSTSSSILSLPLEILKRIVDAYPNAIHQRNFNGETPLDLAESSNHFDDETITFLHSVAYRDEDVDDAPDILF